MSRQKVEKIDFSRNRLKERAEKFYEAGEYLSALRFAYESIDRYGGDADAYVLLADIYENMGLHASAINWWFRFLDECIPEDLPEIYEGLAVNFLNLGNEAQSAFYYNKLLDVDDTLTEENKAEIVDMFAPRGKEPFRFVYPPELADYTRETRIGGLALKNGDLKSAVETLSKVEKGAKEYPVAMEMQAVAYLLAGDTQKAEEICLELTSDDPQNVQALATLSAVYVEQGKTEKSKELAIQLCKLPAKTTEEKYKIATVACENELHGVALELFLDLEKELPYDGNMLFFKSVAAFKSGNERLAVRTLETLCSLYPDAAVAQYYLKSIRKYVEDPLTAEYPEITYFYRLPQKEREIRLQTLVALGKTPKSEAELIGRELEREGYFHWCFDEMDGMETDLQYLGVVTAERARADGFLKSVLLDSELKDVLKLELLRLLYERNEENSFGVVICNIYRLVETHKLRLGVKARGKFLAVYASLSSKFAVIADGYGEKIRSVTENLYAAFKREEAWEYAKSETDVACAVYLLCGFKELGKTLQGAVNGFGAEPETVQRIINIYAKTEEVKEKV